MMRYALFAGKTLPRGVVLPLFGVCTGTRVAQLRDRRMTHRVRETERLATMIVLGIILLIAGFILKISILWTIGIILLVIGVVLAIMGSAGRAVGGRRHYF